MKINTKFFINMGQMKASSDYLHKDNKRMDTTPLVSACCLSYNHCAYIEQTIKSLWEQNYKNIEIIVLDDGSSDGSVNILNDLKKISPCNMTVIPQQNSGNIGRNFNILNAAAKGKYIYFTSCDDMICKETILNAVALMERDDACAFVATSRNYLLETDTNGVFVKKEDPRILKGIKTAQDILNYEYDHLGSFYIQSAVFRKQTADAVGGFDEDIIGDDIVLRIKIAQYLKNNPPLSFKILDNFGFCYRLHTENISRNGLRQVKIVAEVAERFYPDRPVSLEILRWIKQLFLYLPYEEAFKAFYINKKTQEAFLNDKMQDFLILFFWKKNKYKLLRLMLTVIVVKFVCLFIPISKQRKKIRAKYINTL
ncbi:MAG: glycosyltransferase family 2 protein [Endomicrobium sp.]|jgi:alpha-1,3-rhamnosyltransferase|nr:glycosyltransferase family 2 protein [Endomicrobium sp.]